MIQVSFTVTPTSGDVYATDFTFVNTTSSTSLFRHVAWDFNDGTNLIYDTPSVTRTFNYPGTYNIRLSATNSDGETGVFVQTISADLVYRDYIIYTQIPDNYANPGQPTSQPFRIQVVSSQINKPILVDLFSTNSLSIPFEFIPDRWSFLNPTWRFTDTNGTFIKTLSVQSVPVYKNNRVVALSGIGEFYYIDSTSPGDTQENCPLLITCSLQTSSYNYPLESNKISYESFSNNQNLKATTIWSVHNLQPDELRITANYLTDLYSRYWENIQIPFLITAHSNRSILVPGAPDKQSEIIFSYPKTNFIGSLTSVNVTLNTIPSNRYSVEGAPLYFQANDNSNLRTGGYIFTTLTSQQTALNTKIKAETIAYADRTYSSQEFPFPGAVGPNTFVWVSNPLRGTINKINLIPYPDNCPEINFYKENNLFVDGTIKEIEVPTLNNPTTYNYQMSGFAGIYSMAIDPADYSLIACDADLDRIYRISDTGAILQTYELSGLDYIPNRKAFFHWRKKLPTNLEINEQFYLGGSYILSPNSNNYLVSIGGVLQSPSKFTVDPETRLIQLNIFDTNLSNETNLDVVQLFNPVLPSSYINSIQTWEYTTFTEQTTFDLTGTSSLSSSTNYYIAIVDGLVQSPTSFTIDNISQTLTFSQPIPLGLNVTIYYLPYLQQPATWQYTFDTETTTLPLNTNSDYVRDINSEFLVSVGGIFQPISFYEHDIQNQQLVFNTPIPKNIPIYITQVNILDAVNAPANATPAYVSIDRDSNFWVTLFNSVSVLKFDQNFNLLFGATPNNLPPDDDLIFDGDFLNKPSVVETDKDSNCWVSYSHPLCSILVKYSSQGEVIDEINLPQYAVPINLAVDVNNNLWVSSTYNVLTSNGDIRLYNTSNKQLVQTLSNIPRPGYLALDRTGGLWYTHSLSGLGYFSTSFGSIYWDVSDNLTPKYSIQDFYAPNVYDHDEVLGGLAVDAFNRVWLIDSRNNTTKVILSALPTFTNNDVRTFTIRPNTLLGYYLDINTGATVTEFLPGSIYKSAQATGDWTGNKWYQKYITSELLSARPVSGESIPFNIYEFKNEYEIRRVNESFNTSQYYQTLALPETLQSVPVLWNGFFNAAVGTGSLSGNEDIGQIVYERIANFLSNHSDVDTCNVDQLLSLAEQTSVPASDYSTELPAEIKRMIDIASISKNRLWGIEDNKPIINQSIGEQLNTLTSIITAGDKMVLKSKLDGTYTVITIPEYNTMTVYPLSTYEGIGFLQPVTLNYSFYKFVPRFSGKTIENIIDWDSPYTSLSKNLSTFEDWYGDGGIIEASFNYLLTKNLFLK
jgi:hypothetical protein